jgi:hypothetical protein
MEGKVKEGRKRKRKTETESKRKIEGRENGKQ